MDRGILVDRLKFDPINQSNFNRLPYCNHTIVSLWFSSHPRFTFKVIFYSTIGVWSSGVPHTPRSGVGVECIFSSYCANSEQYGFVLSSLMHPFIRWVREPPYIPLYGIIVQKY